ncbi:hypothetical protein HOLleu_44749 [Holothuria leucospilota]|uniref:Uncharacterized protein n=1 Tax=Holothuria leucospilota TaxID=206669 RepID=A0A9Q1B982_HOLLE|nr:hypothetical protein HOLleu_44749 [Holothuria leucospilota]
MRTGPVYIPSYGDWVLLRNLCWCLQEQKQTFFKKAMHYCKSQEKVQTFSWQRLRLRG